MFKKRCHLKSCELRGEAAAADEQEIVTEMPGLRAACIRFAREVVCNAVRLARTLQSVKQRAWSQERQQATDASGVFECN